MGIVVRTWLLLITYLVFFVRPTYDFPLSLHDALPISRITETSSLSRRATTRGASCTRLTFENASGWHSRKSVSCKMPHRSEEHTSELQSRREIVCRLLLEKKK